MAEYILHHKGKYNLYSTASDRFRFERGVTRQQLEAFTLTQKGEAGLKVLSKRLERADKNGHSCLDYGETLESMLICNRAGDGWKSLSTEECIERFLT